MLPRQSNTMTPEQRAARVEALPLIFDSAGATFGTVVRRVREGRRMTMRDVADVTGLSIATLSVIENDAIDPRLSTVARLAEALRIPMVCLLGGDTRALPQSDRL